MAIQNETVFDELLTVDELCNILSIGKTTAYSMIKSHQIEAIKLSSGWRIPKGKLNEYLKERLYKGS